MHWSALLLGLASAGAVALACRSRLATAQTLGLAMVIVWAAANMLVLLGRVDLIAMLDLPIAMAGYAVWHERQERWQAWFAGLYALRLPLHVLGAWGSVDWIVYVHSINALYVAALIAIAWKGGVGDAIDYCRRRLRRVHLSLADARRLVAPMEPPR